LEPGDYTIQQLPSNGGASRVLLFYTDNGMKFETSAMTIPALDINTARDTRLVLNHVGEDYYINKIWVQGKDYGYELPMPKSMKSRENEKTTETTVAAQYQPTSETPKTETAEATEQKATTPPPVTSETPAKPTETEPAQPVETPAPVTTPTPTPTPADANANTADRAMTDQDAAKTTPAPATMPKTAANWLMMLLGGGTLSGAGLMLRRKR
jgi:thiol:disulfide interchange protein